MKSALRGKTILTVEVGARRRRDDGHARPVRHRGGPVAAEPHRLRPSPYPCIEK